MNKKNGRCGIYCITTPNGNQYVGSSINIERRWHEHRSNLRHGKHHSRRLQDAWDKYGATLKFEVITECLREELNDREQATIDRLRPKLNTSSFVRNIWEDPAVRAKFSSIHTSPEWRAERARIAAEAKGRAVAVDCSNGVHYPKMADAARAFGVGTPAIRFLAMTQRAGKLGVRFKFAAEEWREVFTAAEQRLITRIANKVVPSGTHAAPGAARSRPWTS